MGHSLHLFPQISLVLWTNAESINFSCTVLSLLGSNLRIALTFTGTKLADSAKDAAIKHATDKAMGKSE